MPQHPRRSATPVRRRLRVLVAAVALALPAGGVAVTHETAAAAGREMSEVFTVATFNVLGATHTENPRRGFDTYPSRMRRTVRLINEREFDIVGFQEYQWRQHELFVKLTGGTWGVYPGMEHGKGPVQNSIVWRTAEWTLVEKRLYKSPYFYGTMVSQPYVRLRNKATGREVWVINTHNPADARGPAQQWRDQAMAIQADLANRLEATGRPVFLVGDFNDREDAFCAITGQSNLKAANGGSWAGGVCSPPRRSRIDWVFMSKPVQVVAYVDLVDALVKSITDHPVIYSQVRMPLR